MDAFLTSKLQREIVKLLSDTGSKYKIKQMGPALAWEYLRNVGVDGAKPDVHMKRILGCECLGVSKKTKPRMMKYWMPLKIYQNRQDSGWQI